MAVPEWLRGMYDSHFAYYRFFYLLAQRLKPKLSVELGTFIGMAAMCLAKGNPDGLVVSIDITHAELDDRCRLTNVEFRLRDSLQVDEDLQNIDLLYVDAEHTETKPRLEFEAWQPRLAPGALVFFDDIEWAEDMRRFWANFHPLGYEKMEFQALHAPAGFGVIVPCLASAS